MTIAQAAKTWGVHRSRVLVWIRENRIPATLETTPAGSYWVIPDGTPRPEPKPPGRKPA